LYEQVVRGHPVAVSAAIGSFAASA
jgi:hypothetical protein